MIMWTPLPLQVLRTENLEQFLRDFAPKTDEVSQGSRALSPPRATLSFASLMHARPLAIAGCQEEQSCQQAACQLGQRQKHTALGVDPNPNERTRLQPSEIAIS